VAVTACGTLVSGLLGQAALSLAERRASA
jgi:hypothetical protein